MLAHTVEYRREERALNVFVHGDIRKGATAEEIRTATFRVAAALSERDELAIWSILIDGIACVIVREVEGSDVEVIRQIAHTAIEELQE